MTPLAFYQRLIQYATDSQPDFNQFRRMCSATAKRSWVIVRFIYFVRQKRLWLKKKNPLAEFITSA